MFARERLLAAVTSEMQNQRMALRRLIIANIASVWLLLSVRPEVALQNSPVAKLALTKEAGERLFTSVDSEMIHKNIPTLAFTAAIITYEHSLRFANEWFLA